MSYLNDDSEGNKKGEEDAKKETILPQAHRVNYSICSHKNKAYIFGGLNENNEVLDTTEVFEAHTFKFIPVKYRGDQKPVAR